MTTSSSSEAQGAMQPHVVAARSIAALAEARPNAATALARFVAVVADEARRTSAFANRLKRALTLEVAKGNAAPASTKRSRRPPGPWDPHAVFSEAGEEGLRARLQTLDIEQLRDIVAEHGMDTDRLAMKWRDASRVIDRITERVADRADKGEGFVRPDRLGGLIYG